MGLYVGQKIKTIELETKAEVFNWAEGNHTDIIVGRKKYKGAMGYNRVTTKLFARYHKCSYYVIERFDGYTAAFLPNDFEYMMYNFTKHHNDEGSIVNAYVNFRYNAYGGYEGYEATDTYIEDEDEVSKEDYIPKVKGILQYMYNSNVQSFKRAASDREADLEIERTKMTEKEYKGLIAKLNMLGIQHMLVDLNTIATLKKDSNDIMIYTMQKDVEY
jgi:hypothetical protein